MSLHPNWKKISAGLLSIILPVLLMSAHAQNMSVSGQIVSLEANEDDTSIEISNTTPCDGVRGYFSAEHENYNYILHTLQDAFENNSEVTLGIESCINNIAVIDSVTILN